MTAKDAARSRIAAAADRLLELSHRIHAHPETAWQEHRAAGWLTDALDRLGYAVTRGACELSTAFSASIGSGGELHIGICAEYDALPGLGHACGHNIIAAAAIGAATGLAGVADELGLTVTVLGTPAEEGGGGKILCRPRRLRRAARRDDDPPGPCRCRPGRVLRRRPSAHHLPRQDRACGRLPRTGRERRRRVHHRPGRDRAAPSAAAGLGAGARDRHPRLDSRPTPSPTVPRAAGTFGPPPRPNST